MGTSTEFVNEISAPAISTSFDFHPVSDFLVKGSWMCTVYVCECALLSRSLVTPRIQGATSKFDTSLRNKGYNVRLGTRR